MDEEHARIGELLFQRVDPAFRGDVYSPQRSGWLTPSAAIGRATALYVAR